MNWLLRLLPKRIINGREAADQPYMIRYTVLNLFFVGVYLHHILRSDDDVIPHDHPWPFFHLILKGGYYEEYPPLPLWHVVTHKRIPASVHFRGPGYWAFHRAKYLHRVSMEVDRDGNELPSWSLVITGPRTREWGFLTPTGWVQWKTYLDGKHEQAKFNKLVDWLCTDDERLTDAEVSEELKDAGIDTGPALERLRKMIEEKRKSSGK